jgi:hypothetical protein
MTIPASQWPVCPQYTQMGWVLFTMMENCDGISAVWLCGIEKPMGMGMAKHTVASLVALAGLKPDLNPAAVHGAAKVDWVAVWLPATNWKLGKTD